MRGYVSLYFQRLKGKKMRFEKKYLTSEKAAVDQKIAEIDAFFSGTLSLGITLEQRVQLRRMEQSLRDYSAILSDVIPTVA
jgi:hypothetical protein